MAGHLEHREIGRYARLLVLFVVLVACADSSNASRSPGTPSAAAPSAKQDDTQHHAQASEQDDSLAAKHVELPAITLTSAPSVGFLGEPEDAVLERLRHAEVRGIKKGKGGRSLAFKLSFEGGAGYFKPEQTFSGTIWFAEVVTYYLDRALGIGRVPAVVSRRLPWAPLFAAAKDDERAPEVIVDAEGKVRGALIAWLEAPLTPALTPPGWENWIRIEPLPRYTVTPFQRASEYVTALERNRVLAAEGKGAPEYYATTPEPSRADLPAALSDMLVLDYLTLNIDRFGGGNGNVLTLGTPGAAPGAAPGTAVGPLIFLDNAAGFSVGPHRRSLPDQRFFPCQRFRKSTIAALQALDVDAFNRELERDPLAPLLTPWLLEGLAERRQAVLEHVSALREKHGDAAVLAW